MKENESREKTRSDILHGQALFRRVKQLLTQGVWYLSLRMCKEGVKRTEKKDKEQNADNL